MLTLLEIKKEIDALDVAERQRTYLRAMLRPEELPRLKGNAFFADHLQGMREMCENGPESAFKPLTFAIYERTRVEGDRDGAFAAVYFQRHYTLTAQVLMTLVDETDRYLPVIENLIWLICNEYTWATPNHVRDDRAPERMVDLFAAETAQMLAECLTLLDGRLHPSVTHRARQQVEERVFSPMFNDARTFAWESAPNNWAAVCSGSVGMAALLLERDQNRLSGMLRRVLDCMACFLQGFREDGGCEEGIAYWNYGFGFFVYFAESLREFTGGRIDLLGEDRPEAEKIRRVAAFPASIALSDQTFLNYSDALVDMPLAPGLLSRVSGRLGVEVPRPEKMPDYPGRTSTPTKWAHASRTLCWTEEGLFGERKLPSGTIYFANMEWLLDRRYAGADRMIAFSAKGGHNLESHNHNDLGHFIIHAGGENILVDLGQGQYGKGYVDSLNKTSEGHSVPRINGRGQGRGREFRAKVLRAPEATPASAGSGEVVFELDLTAAYLVENLEKFTRRFAWQPSGGDGEPAMVSLTDSFRFGETRGEDQPAGNTIEEFFISFQKPAIKEGEVVWEGKSARVTLEYDAGQLAAEVEPFEVGRGNDGLKQTAWRLGLSAIEPRLETVVRIKFLVTDHRS